MYALAASGPSEAHLQRRINHRMAHRRPLSASVSRTLCPDIRTKSSTRCDCGSWSRPSGNLETATFYCEQCGTETKREFVWDKKR